MFSFSAARPLALCASVTLCALLASTASPSARGQITSAAPASPAAFIYVAGPQNLLGFAAAADGTLTPVPGSPYALSEATVAVTGSYLFGERFDGSHVDAFHIKPDGSLVLAKTTDINQYNKGTTCNSLQAAPLELDHTGATLYTVAYQGEFCDSTSYKSFEINKQTGGLTYLGDSGTRPTRNAPLKFDPTNKFAYGAGCVPGGVDPYWGISFGALERASNGKLTYLNASTPLPATRDDSYFYCPSLTAIDPANNLLVGLYKLDARSTELYNEGTELASYTIKSNGSVTTQSKYNTMPWTTASGELSTLAMSPTGAFVAVGGGNGLEVWHANGAKPPTHYTGLLASGFIQVAFWDNSNHLYVLAGSPGVLHVFTVTADKYVEAPGSPYALPVEGGVGLDMAVHAFKASSSK